MKQAFRPKQEPSQNPGSRPSKHSIKVPEGLTLLISRAPYRVLPGLLEKKSPQLTFVRFQMEMAWFQSEEHP